MEGTIDDQELKHVLDEMGQHLSIETVDELIAEVDTNKDGVVDFGEFKVMVGQSWYINTFQNKLAENIQNNHLRVMSQIQSLPEMDGRASIAEYVFSDMDQEEKLYDRDDDLLQSIDALKQENADLKHKMDTLRGGTAPRQQEEDGRAPDAAVGAVAGWSCLKMILDKFKYSDYGDRPHLYHHFG